MPADEEVVVLPGVGDPWVRRFRRALARFGFVRSSYHLWLAIRAALADSAEGGRAELNGEFEPRDDPWDYATASDQRARIGGEIGMLDAVLGAARFETALEVGCAEGVFTEMLAPCCEHLLALDISPVALARARRRLQGVERVRFAEWDLRAGELSGAYDLIVVIHALEYIRNPLSVRGARKKLLKSLRPGGYLLLGSMMVGEIYENAWWARYFLRSGRRINDFFAAHPDLTVVQRAEFRLGKDDVAYDVLLRKAS